MKYFFISPIVIAILFCLANKPEVKAQTNVEKSHIVYQKKDIELFDPIVNDRETRISQVIQVWNMFLQDNNMSKKDPRRLRFKEFAGYTIDAIETYERNPTDIGGQLPSNVNSHILVASMITKESSVDSTVVGKTHNEVGLLQIHGLALAGHDPEVVRNNPSLGVLLGVRWLAVQIGTCINLEGYPKQWTDGSWLGPLSVYGSGPQAIDKEKKRCREFGFAKERIALSKFYAARIINTINDRL